ncbi:hypothetical protein NZK35_07940 [Stieleria sp. ICT_E10.1]|uniref:hypothetical protein n=1 Tax=Stieleria sedimenti TaxID=2976331 RepID=UPI00217F503D|nr:hypothetical protein [Stieleria sedimenti]MCS7466571.1 hypothetical protein [Stieleria sedimenti]
MSSDLLVRFRAKVSRSNEDANVDNVMISGTPIPTEPLAEFTPLGFLPGATSSDPRGMSADGRYIVGNSGDQAYRWSRDQGMIDLGTFKADDVSTTDPWSSEATA